MISFSFSIALNSIYGLSLFVGEHNYSLRSGSAMTLAAQRGRCIWHENMEDANLMAMTANSDNTGVNFLYLVKSRRDAHELRLGAIQHGAMVLSQSKYILSR